MIIMTFDQYTALDDKIASLPKRIEEYGITEQDMKRIESDPDRYYKYAMYLLNHSYYEPNASVFLFKNPNALPQKEVTKRLNQMLKSCIKITDEI